MKKSFISLKCEKCGNDFDYLYYGRGPKPRYCEDCRRQPTRETKDGLICLRKKLVAEIKELLEEIISIQIRRLEYPGAEDPEFIDDNTISQDFERLERLLDLTCEIDNLLEERREVEDGK